MGSAYGQYEEFMCSRVLRIITTFPLEQYGKKINIVNGVTSTCSIKLHHKL